MARLHLRFKNIKASTVEATRGLFDSGPWTGTDEEKQGKYELWLRQVSEIYGVPAPTLEINIGQRYAGYQWGRITLGAWSVTTMLHDFRHHLQAMGACAADMQDCDDAQGWACSLFYLTKPRMFRRRVREGRIFGVEADDLLSSATLEARENEMYGDEAGPATVTVYGGRELDTVDGSHDDLRPDEDDEENVPATVTVATTSDGEASDEVDSRYIQDTYGVSRSFVSTNAERMGGYRTGSRWKFNRDTVARYMSERSASASR